MGVPVRGTEVVSAIFPETTYGVIPGSPAGERLYLVQNTVRAAVSRVNDPTLSGRRGQPKSVRNEKNVSGQLACTPAAESMCQLLKHLVGAPTAYRPAFNTAVDYRGTTITGIRVLRANALCPTGAGTLTFTAAGTTLTWTPNGGTAGAAVNVSAAGDYTLAGGAANQQLYIRREPAIGALPGGNTTDASVTVHVAYEQAFVVGADLPVGFVLENYLGTKITAAERYQRHVGLRISQGQFNISPSGIAQATFDVIGADYSVASAALDGTLDDFGHKGFSNLDCTVYVDGASSLSLRSANTRWNNDLDQDGRVIGSAGVRAHLEAGFAMVGGQLNALFDSADFLTKARNETEVAFLKLFKRGTGTGLAGNEAFGIDLPRSLISETTPAISGPRGLLVDLEYMSHRPDTTELDITLFTRSTRATV